MANILSIGKSALMAAQVGIDTTGHNIANVSTVGYSREIVLQAASAGQNMGFGFVGKGTQVVAIERVYNEYLGSRVRSTQTSFSQLDTYHAQIRQIDNILADPSIGLSPALQSFFSSVQDVSTSPSSAVARQSLFSSAQAMVSQFNSLSQQLTEISQGVSTQIRASTTTINTYAAEIAKLNDQIESAKATSDRAAPNDLLDQRDQLLAQLSKEIRVTIVKQGSSYDVYIGNGQSLVVGAKSYSLVNKASPTDPSRLEVAYENNGVTTILSEEVLSGGTLSGLLGFRSETLDSAQNSLGRIATVLASTFNEQHRLGQDQNGDLGADFFDVAKPIVTSSYRNTSFSEVTATLGDTKLLTTSDYRISFNGADYILTRISDGNTWSSATLSDVQDAAATQGFNFDLVGTPDAGDSFLIRPTASGASGISLAITDTRKIAAAAPILASATVTNTGTGKITSGVAESLDSNLLESVSIMFTSATTFDVTGTGAGLPATNLSYTAGENISYNGWTVQISGSPVDGDIFTVSPNISGVGDNRNMLLLGELQTSNLVAGNSATYQGAYSQLVNMIGNKTNEMKVTSAAANTLYTQAHNAQQAESGVNLDEEAANLLRYQQAYQAAAKVMKVAGDLFDTLLAV